MLFCKQKHKDQITDILRAYAMAENPAEKGTDLQRLILMGQRQCLRIFSKIYYKSN
ncbi:MAG: hypothetical protein Rpha_1621 [Candidatus Ruthia sp. Apha_13_S6]|nr:hypothetical protein [Candidatus Ruthia sp. Apha_13_S6]